MNETEFEVSVGPVFVTLFVFLWVVALLLNSVSSIFLWREARQRHSWGNILLFCIALLDLLMLIFILFPAIVAIFYREVLQTNTGLCYFQGFCVNTFVLYAFFLVVFISVDQYLAICHPFMYSTQILRHQGRSCKILILVLAALFTVAVTLSVLPKIIGAEFGPLAPPLLCYYNLHSRLLENIVFSSINTSLMIGNSCILLFCCISVGYQFFRLHKPSGLTRRSSSSTPLNRQQVALAKLSVIIAIVFLSCSVPFEVTILKCMASVRITEVYYYLPVFALCA